MSNRAPQALSWWRWPAVATATVVLAGTFTLYADPDFMLQVALLMWFCIP